MPYQSCLSWYCLALEGFKTIIADPANRVPAPKNADPKDYVATRFIEDLHRSGVIDGLYRQ